MGGLSHLDRPRLICGARFIGARSRDAVAWGGPRGIGLFDDRWFSARVLSQPGLRLHERDHSPVFSSGASYLAVPRSLVHCLSHQVVGRKARAAGTFARSTARRLAAPGRRPIEITARFAIVP